MSWVPTTQSKKQIKLWSPRLRAITDKAVLRSKRLGSSLLVCNTYGDRYTSSGFKTVWKKAVQQALIKGAISESFTFHNLKRKGISDYVGDRQAFSGHKTSSMAERYNVTPDRVPSLNK